MKALFTGQKQVAFAKSVHHLFLWKISFGKHFAQRKIPFLEAWNLDENRPECKDLKWDQSPKMLKTSILHRISTANRKF